MLAIAIICMVLSILVSIASFFIVKKKLSEFDDRLQTIKVQQIMESQNDNDTIVNAVVGTYHKLLSCSTISPTQAMKQAKILHGISPNK